jgi:hypothetical protein
MSEDTQDEQILDGQTQAPAAPNGEDEEDEHFVHTDCAACGIEFQITKVLYARRKKDHRSFYCPNGHTLHYPPSEEKVAKDKQIQELKRHVAGRDEVIRKWETHYNKLRQELQETYAYNTVLEKRLLKASCWLCRLRNYWFRLVGHLGGARRR